MSTGIPRAYFNEAIGELERIPDGLSSAPAEPRALLLSKVGKAHRRAARACFRALCKSVQARGQHAGGHSFWIEAEPEIALPGDLLGMPDIAAWLVPHDKELREADVEALVRSAPTLCCKVVTAETVKAYRATKLALYARAGVHWFWLIDPQLQTVEVFSMTPEQQMSMFTARQKDDRPLPPFRHSIALAPFWKSQRGL